MNSNNEIQEPAMPELMDSEAPVVEIDGDSSPSVDDFIKELEAKEKDLHITADLRIEIEDSEFDEAAIPDFVQAELPAPVKPVAPAPRTSTDGMKTRVFELETEIESLKSMITGLRMERNDIQQKSDRRLKDFENYKYRMDRERRGAFITQIGNLATEMLPVMDNLERALDSIADVPAEKRDEFKHFFDGIALVNQQINEVFSDMGVQPIATIGEPFDPNFHEAVATEENTGLPPNTVSGEMRRGYRIGNMVIRHSMVKVTTNGSEPVRKDKKEEPSDGLGIALVQEPDENLGIALVQSDESLGIALVSEGTTDITPIMTPIDEENKA